MAGLIASGQVAGQAIRRPQARAEGAADNAVHYIVVILAPLVGAPQAGMMVDEFAAHCGFLLDGIAPFYGPEGQGPGGPPVR